MYANSFDTPQEYIAGEVDADVGTLTMIAISAHRYFK